MKCIRQYIPKSIRSVIADNFKTQEKIKILTNM